MILLRFSHIFSIFHSCLPKVPNCKAPLIVKRGKKIFSLFYLLRQTRGSMSQSGGLTRARKASLCIRAVGPLVLRGPGLPALHRPCCRLGASLGPVEHCDKPEKNIKRRNPACPPDSPAAQPHRRTLPTAKSLPEISGRLFDLCASSSAVLAVALTTRRGGFSSRNLPACSKMSDPAAGTALGSRCL